MLFLPVISAQDHSTFPGFGKLSPPESVEVLPIDRMVTEILSSTRHTQLTSQGLGNGHPRCWIGGTCGQPGVVN